jgi:AT-binding transcription factor 1
MIDVHRSTNNMVHVDQLTPSCTNTGTARNSSKTLKCPKCNWHYKYQETLEIHMKEKHADSEISCTYCQQNRAHPKLARGETYGCGYKPYRCDICKYSTTTKGNLSIHMQSDKHLNNTHELQLGNKLIDPADLIHVDPPASSSSPPMTAPSINTSSVLVQQQQPAYRCDDCMYQTNIARNLRIHMTSDKHSQNMRRTRATTAMVEPSVGCLPPPSDNNIANPLNQLAFNDDDFASFR